MNTLPYFSVDPPPPTEQTSTGVPTTPPTGAAPVATTTPRLLMAAGTAPANTFTVDRTGIVDLRPRSWIVRSIGAARADLGSALPAWVEQFPFERHALAVIVIDPARERVGCSVLRVSWARAGSELALAPRTACFSGTDTTGADPANKPEGAVTVVAIALPGESVDGVTRVTSP